MEEFKLRQVLYLIHAFRHIIFLIISNFFEHHDLSHLHIEDRLKNPQDWSDATFFMLEALLHAIAFRRSQVF